jgi:ubiquinone/menaquinone biosynthesis C-methylase UbiE
MEIDVLRWLGSEGVKYLRELGLKTGQILVDFGCNEGHYSIPAAAAVGPDGKVYAIDQEESAIDQLKITARSKDLDNILTIISGKPAIDLPTSSADILLIYDVLHYLNDDERITLYQSANRVLKNDGLLSVFPKHNKMDWPMWHLADLNRSEIIGEIEDCGFVLIENTEKRLIHDDVIERGVVINFRKSLKI